MKTVNIHEAKTHLSRYVEEAAAGEEIIIAKAGKPIARLVALEPRKQPRQLGLLKGKFEVPDDFDAPLPDDVIDSFYNSPLFPPGTNTAESDPAGPDSAASATAGSDTSGERR